MNDFIYEICSILDIDIPKISYNTSLFPSQTMLALYSSKENTIFIKRTNKPNIEFFFCIAHELRHAWQIKNNEELYFSNYKTVDKCKSIEEYNLQIAEIDANAFGYITIVDCFGLKILFNNLPNAVKDRIMKRVEEIVIELNL